MSRQDSELGPESIDNFDPTDDHHPANNRRRARNRRRASDHRRAVGQWRVRDPRGPVTLDQQFLQTERDAGM